MTARDPAVSEDATTPSAIDLNVQVVEQAVEAERGGQPTLIRYSTGVLWLGTVGLIGIGALLLIAATAVGASFIAIGGLSLAGLIQVKRIGERALVIDNEGITYTTIWGTQYHVPWSEITGARVVSRGVGLRLRAARSRFRVPPRNPRRSRDRGSLFLPDTLDVSGKDLVELIQPHLPGADDDA